MNRRTLLNSLGLTAIYGSLFSGKTYASAVKMEKCSLKKGEIQHMVIFNLKYEKGSAETHQFIQDGTRILSGIPVVNNFQVFTQVSKKNSFTYGFSMVFSNQEAYSSYNKHAAHVAFVQERWMKEVVDFLEIDFEK